MATVSLAAKSRDTIGTGNARKLRQAGEAASDRRADQGSGGDGHHSGPGKPPATTTGHPFGR